MIRADFVQLANIYVSFSAHPRFICIYIWDGVRILEVLQYGSAIG